MMRGRQSRPKESSSTLVSKQWRVHCTDVISWSEMALVLVILPVFTFVLVITSEEWRSGVLGGDWRTTESWGCCHEAGPPPRGSSSHRRLGEQTRPGGREDTLPRRISVTILYHIILSRPGLEDVRTPYLCFHPWYRHPPYHPEQRSIIQQILFLHRHSAER